jgi:hypothetical protein
MHPNHRPCIRAAIAALVASVLENLTERDETLGSARRQSRTWPGHVVHVGHDMLRRSMSWTRWVNINRSGAAAFAAVNALSASSSWRRR